jgi:hypothetical protein
MHAGRKAAEQFTQRSYGTGSVTRPLQEVVDKLLRFQAEMLPLWLDLFGSLARVDSFRIGGTQSEARKGANGLVLNGNIWIELASARPVEILTDIDQAFTHRPLVTPGLHSFDKNKPALTDIQFTPANRRQKAKLQISVPKSQPAGLYSGAIVDPASGEARGTLSIRVTSNHSKQRTSK